MLNNCTGTIKYQSSPVLTRISQLLQLSCLHLAALPCGTPAYRKRLTFAVRSPVPNELEFARSFCSLRVRQGRDVPVPSNAFLHFDCFHILMPYTLYNIANIPYIALMLNFGDLHTHVLYRFGGNK